MIIDEETLPHRIMVMVFFTIEQMISYRFSSFFLCKTFKDFFRKSLREEIPKCRLNTRKAIFNTSIESMCDVWGVGET